MEQQSQNPELRFQPLTEGLGFHPFSGGLPYAPIAKTLGRPKPVSTNPTPVFHSISVPTAKTTTIVQPLPQPLVADARVGFLYLFKRVFAYLLDSMLNIGLCSSALVSALWKLEIRAEMMLKPDIALATLLFMMVFNWVLITSQEIAFGTTVGKRVFGLSLQGSAWAIFLRAFFFFPSAGFCALGLIWSMFDPKRRCWHDLVVDVQPLETAGYRNP